MPSSVAHGLVALTVGSIVLQRPMPRPLAIAGVACAVLLDIDAIGRPFGHGDIAWLGGHRALTHSVFFAVAIAALFALAVPGRVAGDNSTLRVFIYLALAMLAHGFLDMFTTYGDGVALFAPFSGRRFHAPWELFTGLWAEVLIIWVPTILFLKYTRG